jgi:p90 ribosomal S6 kinase
VTDFYQGGDIFVHYRRKPRVFFDEDKAKLIAAEMVLAIEHIHSLGYIARCIYPENILIDEDGHVLLTDFCFSKELLSKVKPSAIDIPNDYCPFEVLKNEKETKAVDWWTIGILIHETTVGRVPWYGKNKEQMIEKITKSGIRYPPHLSEECKDIISRLLEMNVPKRLGSGASGVKHIKSHPWFQGIDWEKLARKEVDPVFKPQLETAPPDDNYVFPQLDSEDHPTGSSTSEMDLFAGFEYPRL